MRALQEAAPVNVRVVNYHKTVEQNPEAPGFWEMWRGIMTEFGWQPGDMIVASEKYGKRFAQELCGQFFPYDIDRDISYTKASDVRNFTRMCFDMMLPEFQHNIRQTVTVFGAESTGKTTLSKLLAKDVNGHWLFEWARPYLESLDVQTITTGVMEDIWLGQRALQDHAKKNLFDKPFVIQDTDLFSTVGYWDFWDMNTPQDLVRDATFRKSDLYLITQSNIPFEQDPIRYGGDKREASDEFWIGLCEKHNLNYKVLTSANLGDRLIEAGEYVRQHFEDSSHLRYERAFND